MEQDGLKRNENGMFAVGNAGGPGRPKGQSLKEFWRQRFSEMTSEEKLAFTQKVGLDTIWKMAEGNPATATDLTSGGDKLVLNLIQYGVDHTVQLPTETVAVGVPESPAEVQGVRVAPASGEV